MMAPPITVWIALPTRLLMSTEMEIQTGLVTLAPQQGRSANALLGFQATLQTVSGV